jgi:membrane-associated protein
MTSFAAVLLSWLLLYKYTLLFGVFFLSALALPLPGNTLLLATGAFASQGYMNYPLAFASVILGNVLGDVSGYALAAFYGDDVVRKLRIKRSYLNAVERYVAHHPRVTIFISRFAGTLDPVVNILSGLGEVSFKTFFVFDMLGNFVSLGAVISAGYYLGDYWQTFSGIIETAGWIVFAAITAGAILVIFRRRIGLSESSLLKQLRHQARQFMRKYGE